MGPKKNEASKLPKEACGTELDPSAALSAAAKDWRKYSIASKDGESDATSGKFTIKCTACSHPIRTPARNVGREITCPNCKAKFFAPLTVLAPGVCCGDYWLQRKLGAGNISEVYQAKRLSDDTKLCVKVLTPRVTEVEEDVEHFLAEICRCHQIEEPSIVSVFEIGMIRGHYYLTMPYIEGETIQQRVDSSGVITEKETLKLALQVARVLRMCWEAYQLTHRAIRPSNIMIDGAGQPFLLDMGNCKQLLASAKIPLEKMNLRGSLVDYFSPQQSLGCIDVDCASDIYSLGAVMYFMVAGKPPYQGEDTDSVLQQHIAATLIDPRKVNSAVTKDGAKLIRSMMGVGKEKRIRTWREVIQRIKKILKKKTLKFSSQHNLRNPGSTDTFRGKTFKRRFPWH